MPGESLDGQSCGTAYAFPGARILIFAKAPVPGRVKTRLIPVLGAEGAAALHESLVADTLARVTAARLAPVELWCGPDDDKDSFLRSCSVRFEVPLHHQQGKDLGERMRDALEAAPTCSSSALIVGSDCPELGPAPIRAALRLLEERVCEAVFGTVEDGGYGLVGTRRAGDALFHDIDWGSNRVMTQTRERLREAGWRWAEIAVGWDVDRPEDLARLRRSWRDLQPQRRTRTFVRPSSHQRGSSPDAF